MNQTNSPLSNVHSLSLITEDAEKREKDYDWLGAAELYNSILNGIQEQDFSIVAQTIERLAHAFYRSAFQAENEKEFRERMQQASLQYERAKESFDKADIHEVPKAARCNAMVKFVAYWLAPEPTEKRRLLEETWRLTKESLKVFGTDKDPNGFAETYNQLHMTAIFHLLLEGDFHGSEQTLREAVEHGEHAIRLLSLLENPGEMARALATTAIFANWFSTCLPDPEEQQKYVDKALGYWNKAKELSEEAALLQLSQHPVGAFILPSGSDETLANLRKALEQARKTGDRLITGSVLDQLAYHTGWKAVGSEDPDLLREALQYGEEAKNHYSQLSLISPRGDKFWIEAPAEFYWQLALFETDPSKRRDLLEKSLGLAEDGLKLAGQSGYPEVIGLAHHVMSKTLASLAKLEAGSEERKRLLEMALEHRRESIRITEQLQPFLYWNQGVMQNYLGDVKSQLAEVTEDPAARKNIFEEALHDKESSLRLCTRNLSILSLSQFGHLGRWQYQYGDFLNRSYELTKEKQQLRKAAQAFLDAAESYQRLNLRSRVAECCWKAAQAYDTLDEHLRSAENFTLAANNYTNATQEIPQLGDFYHEHASYMKAWSEIEKARHAHLRRDYVSANESYQKVANLHKTTSRWSCLAPNYSAWAKIEEGEGLYLNDRSQEAAAAFEDAITLFREAKKLLETQLPKIDDQEEKLMVTSLAKAADVRQDYCRARVTLEEARILHRSGEHDLSKEKYQRAIGSMEKVRQAIESEKARNELSLIILLSKALQKTAQAEAEASPQLYMEASTLFEEAKEFSLTEKAKMLALGHSRFCKALEAGARFADTRDPEFYANAVQYLASASDYYMKAGVQSALEYAEATERLFDAYTHMSEAKKEKDPEKRARLYALAEKVLQASAEAYLKAGWPARKEQVLKLLDKVQKERQLAVSLTELLYAPSVISATSALTTPALVHERSVGLERFEHADIQASVIARDSSLKVGEALELEIELVNAGRSSAQLIKVEGLIPEGFEVTSRPDMYRLEEGFLNLKGKQLGPLKTEELRLVLRPKAKGQYTIRPRILYLDESGKYKTHEPEPVEIIVKELGLSGWVKGR